jgi:hypothetical protein
MLIKYCPRLYPIHQASREHMICKDDLLQHEHFPCLIFFLLFQWTCLIHAKLYYALICKNIKLQYCNVKWQHQYFIYLRFFILFLKIVSNSREPYHNLSSFDKQPQYCLKRWPHRYFISLKFIFFFVKPSSDTLTLFHMNILF